MKTGPPPVWRCGPSFAGRLPQADAPAALFAEGLEKLRRARIICGPELLAKNLQRTRIRFPEFVRSAKEAGVAAEKTDDVLRREFRKRLFVPQEDQPNHVVRIVPEHFDGGFGQNADGGDGFAHAGAAVCGKPLQKDLRRLVFGQFAHDGAEFLHWNGEERRVGIGLDGPGGKRLVVQENQTEGELPGITDETVPSGEILP